MAITNALLAFGKWVAFFDATGSVSWKWFGDPLGESFNGMEEGDNRIFLAEMMRELVSLSGAGSGSTVPIAFTVPGYEWEPFNLGGGVVSLGVVWNDKTNDFLELGVGVDAKIPAGGQQVNLGLFTKLLKVDQKKVIDAEIGNTSFAGKFPVPSFLTSGTIAADIKRDGNHKVSIGVDRPPIPGSAINSRALSWVNAPVDPAVLAWDAARIAMFIIQAWTRSKATPNGTDFFSRVDEHFFPMFGEPPNGTIQPFPLFQPQGQAANFDAWSSSVITLDGGAGGALTFLWHLRALLTGNESSDFLSGSIYFPLHGNPVAGSVPNLNNPSGNMAGTQGPGAWLGIVDVPGGRKLSLVIKDGSNPNKTAEISLGQFVNGTVSLPTDGDAFAALNQLSDIVLTNIPVPKKIEIVHGNATTPVKVTVFKEAVNDPIFGGTYSGTFTVAQNGTIGFLINLPTGDLPFPPPAKPEQVLGIVIDWIVRAAGAVAGDPAKPLLIEMAKLVRAAIEKNTLTINDMMPFVSAMAAVAGNGLKIEKDPLTITFGPSIKAELEFKNLKFEEIPNALISIGLAEIEAELKLNDPTKPSFRFALTDLRLSQPGGSSTGLVSTILPDLTKAPGFNISVKVNVGGTLEIKGGGKIPIQKTIGPVDLTALLIEISNTSLMLGIDLTFLLGPIMVSVFELGVKVDFDDGKVEPFLHGLAVSMDTSVVKLAGMFGEIKKPGLPSDYVGGAVVSVVDMFELTAIGGYSQTASGDASLFIFASLVAPLGGPPYLFITGIAGGFGFNRKLPPPGLLYEHPFLQVMAGELDIAGGAEEILVKLSEYFAVTQDTYWLAGGIQFISFGFIYGKLVVAVQFGHSFAISVLGMAAFGIAPLAYFEIAIEVSADEEMFLLKAGISPNSYIIHPDIFSLRGDFGLGVWYDGDFVLSIGGFHPFFPVPERYASLNLNRVGVKAVLWGFLRISVECFFACTPQALMAGASVTIAADFEGIGAGLDVYIDVLITWDPFFLWARMKVTVWFEFMGRHEISVGLEIWTPEFGGVATIDLAIVSFDIEFGAPKAGLPPPDLADFATNQLGVPATGGDIARMAMFNTDDAAGLLRVDIIEGSISKDTDLKKSSKQQGMTVAIPVKPEFAFAITTKLPFNHKQSAMVPGSLSLSGLTDLALCGDENIDAKLTISAAQIDKAKQQRLEDFFPAAEFGKPFEGAQADDTTGRAAIADMKSEEPSVELTDGIQLRYEAQFVPANFRLTAMFNGPEPSSANETYPLPLGWVGPGVQLFRDAKTRVIMTSGAEGMTMAPKQVRVARRVLASQRAMARKPEPLKITAFAGDIYQRNTFGAARLKGQTLAKPPAGVPVIAPPVSPLRTSELYGVTLRVVPPRAAVPIVRRPPTSPTTVRPTATRPTAKRISPAVASRFRTPLVSANPNVMTLAAGATGEFIIKGDNVKRVSVKTTGTQIVRAVALTGFGEPVGDVYLPATGSAALDVRTRRVVLIGEGLDAAVTVGATAGIAGVPPALDENAGIEHDSTLLALAPRVFAGKGCVVAMRTPLAVRPATFESIPAYEILQGAKMLRVFFPALKANWSLVITVEAKVAEPADAVDQVRWRTNNATLRDLHTIIDTDRVAFIMSPTVTGPWSVDVDLGPEWRLSAVAVCAGSARETATKFRKQNNWDLIDDRFEKPAAAVNATVTLEVAL